MRIRTQPVARCPVCGGVGHVRHASLEDRAYGISGSWEIDQCDACGSGWLSHAPVPEDLGQCYNASYYTHVPPEPASLGRSAKAVFLRRLALSARKGYTELRPAFPFSSAAGTVLARIPPVWRRASFGLEDWIPPFRRGGRLLEIGCGDGRGLSIMRLLGWTVYGIEFDPQAAEVARAAVGCQVHIGTVENAPFDPEQFDAVISSHVIEHVYDPHSFIAHAGRFLAPGGSLRILTPNYASLGHSMLGSDWYCLDPPRHLCLFTPRAITKLITSSGLFQDIRTRTTARHSEVAILRWWAVQNTGNFLADSRSSKSVRGAGGLFRQFEAEGKVLFQ
jgi:2-polyprenyl-3-methyl-5-hydroxy-6-metoxy-1,4-benzoquinol methylase